MPLLVLRRLPLLTVACLLSNVLFAPSAALAQDGQDAVTIDISLLPVGDRFGAPSLGKTLRRVLVVRVGKAADVNGKGWIQVELISPEGKTVARHASPEVSLKPGGEIKGRYLFPTSTADRFPELLEAVYVTNEDGERMLRKSAFAFGDNFTFVGENVEADGQVFQARLMVFLKSESGASIVGDTSMTLVLNQPKSAGSEG